MDWLFGQLHGLFGNKFLDAFRSGHIIDGRDSGIENMKCVWREKIRSNALKFADVRRGLAGAERLKWPPSWGEFLELCKPALDVDESIREAVEQMAARRNGIDQWSSPAIYWAAVRIGEFDLLSLSHAQIKPRFASALAKVIEGGEIPPVPARVPALAAPGKSESTRQHGRQQLDALINDSGLLRSVKQGGGREWAHRIIKAHGRGEAMPAHRINFAHEALAA
ncbi:hypothetical protein [Paraburkholderia sp. RL17-381-BIF-C]|uniref:hypothetical protein n=1 Tax=Paraburkholderia sp. RL17-381-BIF-C TaxID=3031635 RepID=UPI0038B6E8FD